MIKRRREGGGRWGNERGQVHGYGAGRRGGGSCRGRWETNAVLGGALVSPILHTQ